MAAPRNIIQKIWDAHVVTDLPNEQALLHIDRIFLHERTGPALLDGLKAAGHRPAHPELVFGTMDHIVDTTPNRTEETMFKGGASFIRSFRENALAAKITLFDLRDRRQGIVHVVSPEQGIALPGLTLVCPDSHTCTVGGIGALAWGIGSTEGEHAVATQTLIRPTPKTMFVDFTGTLACGVTAKDMILGLLAKYGATGGQNAAIEFGGEAIRALDVEGRMTLCNMAVEFGAWTGLVAPDTKTISWLRDRPYAPKGAAFDAAAAHWLSLASEAGSHFDVMLSLDCNALTPQVTWGTTPAQGTSVSGSVPMAPSGNDQASADAFAKALAYIDLEPGQRLQDVPIEAAFIGSCTNSRLPDLRAAAALLKGKRIAPNVKALVVPGSGLVKQAAEAEGLDVIFREAGFEWRESGCSLCFFAGGDSFGAARRVISTTNRNFEGRQGPGVRTHLASPLTVAASAITGRITDPRTLMEV